MIQAPGLLLTILAFALVIGPLIFVHELGHYLAGRVFGVKAETFSIGFGREIGGWTDKRGTRWKLSLLPLGGYVKFAGDLNAASQPDAAWLNLSPAERTQTLPGRPVWQRAIIVAAGPLTNFLVAILILAGFAVAYGQVTTPATVGGVQAGSAAAKIGLQAGDHITSLNGRGVDTFNDVRLYVVGRGGQRVTIDFDRAGQHLTQTATIGAQALRDEFGNSETIGLLGVAPVAPQIAAVSVLEAPVVATRMVGQIVRFTAETLGQVVTGERSIKTFHGPVGMARVSGEQLSLGPVAFVWLIAFVSINLGFINLLPLPMLDGGHLFFYAIEAIRRRPVEPQVQEWAFRGGLALILALMLLVTFNDLGDFGVWKNLAGLIG